VLCLFDVSERAAAEWVSAPNETAVAAAASATAAADAVITQGRVRIVKVRELVGTCRSRYPARKTLCQCLPAAHAAPRGVLLALLGQLVLLWLPRSVPARSFNERWLLLGSAVFCAPCSWAKATQLHSTTLTKTTPLSFSRS
jgi:hypothetical protein